MAALTQPLPAAAAVPVLPGASRRFAWAATALGFWTIGGVYLDGWAHRHGHADTSFFTPWHAFLYTGAAAIMLFLGLNLGRALSRGADWRRALPAGYLLSFVGALLFGLGGALDLVWHTLFGIEVKLEALLSPTHLLLAFSGVLMVTGPLRAAWQRPASAPERGWAALGPLVISATLFLSVITFFTSYAHALDDNLASSLQAVEPEWLSRAAGMGGLVLQALFLVGLILPLTRRFSLPVGALTVIIGLNSLGMSTFRDRYALALAALIAGLLADVLYNLLRPAAGRARFYAFAIALPMLVSSAYFAALAATDGLAWTLPLWAGAITLTGLAGLLVALLLQTNSPPAAQPPA